VDSLRVETDARSGDSLLCNVVIAFRDPAGVKNFYEWNVTADDSAADHVLTVTVRQTALSEETVRYLSTLTDQTSSTFSPFAVPTANLRGNISNVTNPSHRALGFFQAGEVAEI
jgi:hypothetical protein